MHEVTSTLREMDLTLQIGVAVYHLANYICSKLIMILLINILVVKILTCATFQTRKIPRKMFGHKHHYLLPEILFLTKTCD